MFIGQYYLRMVSKIHCLIGCSRLGNDTAIKLEADWDFKLALVN